MFTKYLLIQKLEDDGKADFHLLRSDYIQWMFENRRASTQADSEYFPFIIESDKVKVTTRPPGAETRISVKKNEIIFADDYAVLGGFTIAILFPKNYIPDVLKFKDKPIIPIGLSGQFTSNAQGQFQILYNKHAKRSAIVFNIHQNVCFGFKCKAKRVSNTSFPSGESIYADDFFDVSISNEFLKIDEITNEDLKIVNKILGQTDLEDIKNSLNEILNNLKNEKKNDAKSSLDKLGKYILNGTSLAGNLTKIIDSYNEDGAPQKFVAKLFEYIDL